MKQLGLMLLVGCAAGKPVPETPQPLTTLTQADFDARIADHRLRYADLPSAGPGDTFGVEMFGQVEAVRGHVLATLWCRPGGPAVQILTDGNYIYTHFQIGEPLVIRSPDGQMQPTPSTYCSTERFTLNLPYGGDLAVK